MDNTIDINEILNTPPSQTELDEFFSGRDPAWHRVARGAYDAPHNWWITWIHLSMLSGAWGSNYKGAAQINQQRLNLILERILMSDHKDELFWEVLQIALKYKKAYFLGRTAGSYYVIGKATDLLTKAFPPVAKILAGLGNFGAVSFGTAILSCAKGYTSAEDIVLSMITGEAQRAPILSTNTIENTGNASVRLIERFVETIEDANDYDPSMPVSYADWCKQNSELKKSVSVCQ